MQLQCVWPVTTDTKKQKVETRFSHAVISKKYNCMNMVRKLPVNTSTFLVLVLWPVSSCKAKRKARGSKRKIWLWDKCRRGYSKISGQLILIERYRMNSSTTNNQSCSGLKSVPKMMPKMPPFAQSRFEKTVNCFRLSSDGSRKTLLLAKWYKTAQLNFAEWQMHEKQPGEYWPHLLGQMMVKINPFWDPYWGPTLSVWWLPQR